MKKKNFCYIFIAVVLTMVSLASCNDVWESHYNDSTIVNKSSLNLYEYIKTQPDLSIFTQMLQITGYDSILSKPQTYTVWAPVNNALQGINMSDTAVITEIVQNHISRFSYPTSGLSSKIIYMLDKKFISFSRGDNGFTFGGKLLLNTKSNVAASNGILHQIDGYVPYLTNIWEFIGKADGLDSVRAYLYSQSVYEFDPKASVEIGTNEFGQSIYDSIITFSNPVLSKIGFLHVEDSTYTALLPNNAAWIKAYNRIKPNYKTLDKDGGATQQRLNTQYAIVNNLIFRKLVTDPGSVEPLISTTGSVFTTPAYLFEGSTKSVLSNGLVYTTDSIRFKAADSYQQKIKVEAENSSYGRASRYASLSVLSSKGSSLSDSVSGSKYLVVYPTTVSNNSQNSVTFPLPNVLSGKYNIYCVFVPASVITPGDTKANKVKFFFNHLDATGKQAIDTVVTVANKLVTTAGSAGIFATYPSMMTKVFVTQFTFPFCNLYGENSTNASIVNKLRVENVVKITETVLFDRTMRIDYIVLEPAQ
ncbi:MAG TPA: fasciclin domain-containing protein [Paludibacter sp.]